MYVVFLEMRLSPGKCQGMLIPYSGYQSQVPYNNFFPISKTKFWWTSIKCIHDNSRVHFVSVSRRYSIVIGSGIIAQLL